MRIHFSGIGGFGMSALAQIHAMDGAPATGSDRLFDQGGNQALKAKLEALGVRLFAQDGSAVQSGTDLVVLSTAIEDDNPEVAAARRLGISIKHRSEFLAEYVSRMRTIAVTGTSGKSTVVAMIYEILEAAGRSPSVITGGNLIALQKRGFWGNAFRGKSDLLVIEADESDGSLLNYQPAVGVFLNLTKDHKEIPVLKEFFRRFRGNVGTALAGADDPNLADLAADRSFGLRGGQTRAEVLALSGAESRFRIDGTEFVLPLPGRYNVENAVAAVAAAVNEGVSLEDCRRALGSYQGVGRRFQSLGQARGVEVIDDFAHNPAKLAAAIAAAHLRAGRKGVRPAGAGGTSDPADAGRVLAVYQPHGFAPTRMLKNELIEAFTEALGPEDRLWLPDIYYVGGTTAKDISSRDVVEPLQRRGRKAFHVPRRADIVGEVAAQARAGDVVLVMGARDPSLSDFAHDILRALSRADKTAA